MKSNNRNKARLELARLHRKVTNQRNDYHWKLAKYLCNKYSIICLEILSMKQMQKNMVRKLWILSVYVSDGGNYEKECM